MNPCDCSRASSTASSTCAHRSAARHECGPLAGHNSGIQSPVNLDRAWEDRMRAAVLRGGVVEARETDDPTPGRGQILVRSLACGICASDIHFMDHPEADAEDDTGLSNYDPDADIVMGHEYCAEVVDYGPGTERRWPPGTRVSSIPALLTAGGVRVIGQSPEAPGGFGEYFLLTEAMTQVVPTDLPSELVAIADAISVGWYYVNRAAVGAREVPLVIGCGAIGLSAIASLRRLG